MDYSRLRQLLGCFLAPAILLLGAGIHAYLVRTQNLTPWEGGGFGMFSTIDHQHARFVRVYLITPQGEVPVRTPGHLDTYVRRLRAMPTREKAALLARYLAQSAWVRAGGTSPAAADSARAYRYKQPWERIPPPRRAHVKAVRVEVWRYRFDAEDQKLTAELMVRATQTP